MKKLLFILIAITTFMSCRVTYVPPKSPEQITNAVDFLVSVNDLYDGIIAGDKYYKPLIPEYDNLEAKAADMVLINQNRPHAKNILEQTTLLQSELKDIRLRHEQMDSMPVSIARSYRLYFKSFIRTILTSEFSLEKVKQ